MTDGASASDAINAALNQNWKDAITINTQILKSEAKNVDALNRLGFAYLQIGNATQAKQCFTKVLVLDQYNHIAEKNLQKISGLRKKSIPNGTSTLLSPLTFLEEPGKTKLINCLNVASAKVLSSITSGQVIYFKLKKHCIEIRDSQDVYLAVLPDDISFKLLKYISGGNTYSAHVKSVEKNAMTVFLRELTRGKKFANQPSFTQTSGFIPQSRYDQQSTEKPDMSATGEDSSDSPEEI